jgi:MtN3 and saliva related transmembrane protein
MPCSIAISWRRAGRSVFERSGYRFAQRKRVKTRIQSAPQFIKVWKTRSARDISLGMFLVMVLGLALWLVYGLLSGDAPLVAANAITMVLAGGILFMKLRYG